MSVKKIDELKQVIKSGLCNRCGSCVGLSSGRIQFVDKEGAYLPFIPSNIEDELASVMNYACTARNFNFHEMNNQIFKNEEQIDDKYLGRYKELYIGHTNDTEVRKLGSSGGIISQILIWLLEKGSIDGAVVLDFDELKPWLTKPVIATSKERILECAQSKYIISSVNEILPQIKEFKGNLAFVGLPGQIQSIRKLQLIGSDYVTPIKYLFGPFFGNTLHFSSIKSLLKAYKFGDHHEITKLQFRFGEWPGSTKINLKSGKEIILKKFHANYLIPFHIVKQSLLCADFTNEFTDISGGDAWAPVYEERGKGFSTIITRTEVGSKIIREMTEAGVLTTSPIESSEAVKMHSHAYDLKKRGTLIRIKFLKILGRNTPEYGLKLESVPFKRYFFEILLDLVFIIGGSQIFKKVIEIVPPRIMGAMFEKARVAWKGATAGIKREQL